jgi:hypothetical protein
MNPEYPKTISDWHELTADELARLDALSLHVSEFLFFRDTFVSHAYDYTCDAGNGWRTVFDGRLTNDELIRHLEGLVILGTGCGRHPENDRYITHRFVIDLDPGPDQWEYYQRVRGVFGDPLLFRSSARDGLHAHYFLSEAVECDTLYHPGSGDGLLPRLLSEGGIELAPGRVEIMPLGKYINKHGTPTLGRRARLPFGRDYQLLEHDTGIAMSLPGVDSLRRARDVFTRSYVEPVDVEDLRADAARIGRPGRRPTRRAKGSGSMASALADHIARLDNTGLERPGELNDALFAKAVSHALSGLTQDEAAERLVNWLDASHNGQSTTYNRDPQKARAKALEISAYVYDTWRHASSVAPRPGLTEYEATMIHALINGDGTEVPDPETGECFARYKVEAFIFEVMNGMKQWVMTRCLFAARNIVARHPDVAVGSAEFDVLFAKEVRRFWPNPNVPLFIVENPYAFRRSIDGVSEASVTPLWRIAKHTGLFHLARRAHQYSGRCEAYTVRLDFNDSGTRTVRTMAEALVAMLPPSELREQYSAHYAQRIRKEGHQPATTRLASAHRDAVIEYVARRLDGMCHACAARSASHIKAA